MSPKTLEAKKSWCQGFTRRNHLTIRRFAGVLSLSVQWKVSGVSRVRRLKTLSQRPALYTLRTTQQYLSASSGNNVDDNLDTEAMRVAERMRPSTRKRLSPDSASGNDYIIEDENNVTDGSDFALGTTSSSSLNLGTRSTRIPTHTKGKHTSRITTQLFRLRTNKKVGDRNAIIHRTSSDLTPIPETWVRYAKALVCTHAGKYKSRGKGKSARQEYRSTEWYNLQCRVLSGTV
ncbi:hypothetical protein GN958_ATG22493, partial [Phytophthora infestans]